MAASTETREVSIYSWREGSPFTGDAAPVGHALDALAKKLGNPMSGLTAQDVVDEATNNPRSVLRSYFDWDDESAAQKFRLVQARNILGSIRITVVTPQGERHVPARVVIATESKSYYVPTTMAQRKEETRIQMIAAAQAGLRGWQKRYGVLSGFDDIVELIEEAIRLMELRKGPSPRKDHRGSPRHASDAARATCP